MLCIAVNVPQDTELVDITWAMVSLVIWSVSFLSYRELCRYGGEYLGSFSLGVGLVVDSIYMELCT